MIETLNSHPAAPADEVLRLKCPSCGGGLNLKRRFLGVKGQCVHCHLPLTAVEENGVAHVITDTPAESIAAPNPALASTAMQPPAAAQPDTNAHAAVPHFPEAPAQPVSQTSPTPASSWGFPDFDSLPVPATLPIENPVPESSAFVNFGAPELAPPLPSRDGDDLFSGRHELPAPAPVANETKTEISPFGESAGFSLSSSLFGSEAPATDIAPAWGTNVPRETHASISPFSTGSAEGGGFAESLFREKVAKDSASGDTGASASFASPFAPMPAPAAPVEESAAAGSKRDCQEFVILDGDGRPMRPMSKEEEEEFAKNFFKYDNARTKPTWLSRLRKKLLRMLIFFCIVGAIGAGASFFVPKETLVVWKEKVIKWLEPGMAILDYLPAGLRPDWLPQTDFGIDAGVDENGKPKKKLNAFEGLDKLKGDIGDMGGAADKQLEELKNF
jgi:hypothetical protein